jgi:virginiamycin B lyase
MPALAPNRLGAYNVTGSFFGSTANILAASNPVGVAADSNGNLWVTESATNTVQEVSPAGAILATVPLVGTVPLGITRGSDGMMYVADSGSGQVEEINPTTGLLVGVPLAIGGTPEGIASAGPFLWVTQNTGNSVQQVGNGLVLGVAIAAGIPPGAAPTGIAAGPGGNTVWFTETGGGVNDIQDITGANTAVPVLGPFTLPRVGAGAINAANYVPVGITLGSDGAMWFTLQTTAPAVPAPPLIGRIGPTGAVTSIGWQRVPVPAAYQPVSITSGPDGNLWFTMRATLTGGAVVGGANGNTADRIGVVNLRTGVVNSQELPSGADFLFAANDLFPFGIADPPAAKSAPVHSGTSGSTLASKPGGLRFF